MPHDVPEPEDYSDVPEPVGDMQVQEHGKPAAYIQVPEGDKLAQVRDKQGGDK